MNYTPIARAAVNTTREAYSAGTTLQSAQKLCGRMDTAKHRDTSPAVLAMDSTLEDSHQTTRRPPDDKGGTSAETFLKDSFTPTASHSQFACSAKRRNSVTKASRLQRTIEVTHESTSEGSSKIEHSEGDNDADSAEATVPIKQSSENIDIDLNATMEKLSQVSLEITKDDTKRKKGEKYTRRAVMYLFDQGLSMEQVKDWVEGALTRNRNIKVNSIINFGNRIYHPHGQTEK